MNGIRYDWIDRAIKFYQNRRYWYVPDAPWIVSDGPYHATKPEGSTDFSTFMGNLVASGEQSFLEMMQKGILGESGLYVCCTPCFRDEIVYNALYRPYFLKVELICTFPTRPQTTIHSLLNDAMDFFTNDLKLKDCEKVETNDGYDIEYKGVEIGSYGVRQWGDFEWIYGTGLAEPRTSYLRSI